MSPSPPGGSDVCRMAGTRAVRMTSRAGVPRPVELSNKTQLEVPELGGWVTAYLAKVKKAGVGASGTEGNGTG